MLIIGQQKSKSSHFRWFLPLGVPLFLVWLFLAVMAVIGVLHPHRQGNDPREVAEQDNRGGKSSHFRGFLPLGVPLFLLWLFSAVMAVIGVLHPHKTGQ